MSETDLTKFLWKQHKLVYLRPVNASDFELLDVLVKIEEKGLFRRRPVLQRIGSIFGVAGRITTPYHDAHHDLEEEEEEEEEEDNDDDDDDDDPDEIILETLKEELHKFRSCGPYLDTFFHGRQWKFKGESSVSVEASVSEIGALGGGDAAGKFSIIKHVESERVDIPALSKGLSSKIHPWSPNIDYIKKWCAPRNQRELELWVVTRLVYHSGISFANNSDRGAQAHVAELHMGIGAGKNTNREVEIELGAGERIAFAYQAIRLKYNLEDGKLTNPSLHMGTPIPIMRKAGEAIISDPDDKPDINMGDLLDIDAWESLPIESAPASTETASSTAP